MILKHLINPKPSIIFFFIIFCVLFCLLPLSQFEIDDVFSHSYLDSYLVLLLALVIPFLLSIGLNNIIYEKNIIKKENLVISCVFILITTPFFNTVEVWISSFLLLFLFNFLLESYQNDLPFSHFYNASMILGLLIFIYPNLICLVILLIISGINYSNLNWRIIFTVLLGIITPSVFYFVFTFVSDANFYLPKFFNYWQISFLAIELIDLSKIIWLVTLLLTVLASFFELYIWLYKKSIKSRRTFMTIMWFFIICFIIATYSSFEYFYFSQIPLAIIISNYFVYTKNKKIANILFFLLLVSSFYYKFMIVFNV